MPTILDLREPRDTLLYEKLLKSGARVVDEIAFQMEELRTINPKKRSNRAVEVTAKTGKWIFFPWKNSIAHLLNEEDFIKLKNSRNQFLLNANEQKKYYQLKIGIAGLSVGASVATVLLLEGAGKTLKIADKDKLGISNLNRVPVGITQIGRAKVDIASENFYEINPYIQIHKFTSGLQISNINTFFTKPKLDLVIEETDDLTIKYEIRLAAKKFGVPLIMATSLDSLLLIDFEAYGSDHKTSPFNGRLTKDEMETLTSADIQKKVQGAIKIVGYNNFSQRLKYSFSELGKTIFAFPQLAAGTYLRSAAIAHFIRMTFVLGSKKRSGRYRYDLNELIR